MKSLNSRIRPVFCQRLLGAAFLLATVSRAAQLHDEPVLRIEAGMHTAMINRIATDAKGRWLATASHDKTLRVWEIDTGRFLHVLRPPAGPGDEGKLYAVAMSPDGELIATGGWTHDAQDSGSLYVFRRNNGNMVKRVDGLPGRITGLAWSPDGRQLAMSLSKSEIYGVRAYRTTDFLLLGEDQDYGAVSYTSDFDRMGRLVTGCNDGFVRLYRLEDTSLRLLVKKRAEGGKEVSEVRFSPDGRLIAVGFADSRRVNVLNGDSLALEYSPDTIGVTRNVGIVCWSMDGRSLFAGGEFGTLDASQLRTWRRAGRGSPTDWLLSKNSASDLRALPDGGVVFAASDPAWGVLNAKGQRIRFLTSSIAEFPSILLVGEDKRGHHIQLRPIRQISSTP